MILNSLYNKVITNTFIIYRKKFRKNEDINDKLILRSESIFFFRNGICSGHFQICLSVAVCFPRAVAKLLKRHAAPSFSDWQLLRRKDPLKRSCTRPWHAVWLRLVGFTLARPRADSKQTLNYDFFLFKKQKFSFFIKSRILIPKF